MWTRTKFILLALGLGLMASAVWAAKATIQEMPDQDFVRVEINKGTMIRLTEPVSSVVIADPSTADVQVVSSKLFFVHGKKIGETSIYAVDAHDNMVFSAVVNVTHNISQLERMVKRVVPNSDVQFNTVDGGLVMEGFTNSADESEKISNVAKSFIGANDKMVNMVRTNGSDQVMLKVKIVEMTHNDLKRVGASLQNVMSNGDFAFQVMQGQNILFNTATAGVTAYSTWGNTLARTSSNPSNVLLRYKDLAGLLDALETNGLATVLAEPTLSTTSGKAANFLAGGQFPIPSVGEGGVITIQYQPFGVGLNFTPVVMDKDRISLTVAPEVSTLNFSNPIQVSGITYPILNTRKASAVVELGSGDSFMLAGLLQNDSNNSVSKFPGLGDVPVLGSLFRSTQFQKNETELVILVTPYIVKPVKEAEKLQTPLDGYKPPSDFERLLLGMLYQQEPLVDEKNMPRLHGEGGFILE